MKRARLAALALAAAVAVGADRCRIVKEDDPLLNLDVADGATWDAAEIVPFAPWIRPGRDRAYGTRDDRFEPDVLGDVDLVLRTGRTAMGVAVPPPASADLPSRWPQGVAEPFGEGTPVSFAIAPVDAWSGPPPGARAEPPYWNGLPLLVFAFADLDGDGWIGVTHLDGDPADAGVEEAEWEPVARRFAFGAGGLASGSLQIGVGGPSAQPARVALAAAAWAGGFDAAFLGGNVPRGPAVMTRLPFHPETAPDRVLEGGAAGPPPAAPGALVGVELRVAVAPDPGDPRFGERFTLRLDGSDPTIDVARVRAGAASRFGAVAAPDPATYLALPERPLRPGLAPGGAARGVEVLERLALADDGAASRRELRVVALDRLGNVTEPAGSTAVTLRVVGPLVIAAPDQDGDPTRETVVVADAVGTAVEIDDTGGALDGADAGSLRVETPDAISSIAVLLPDPDVDDSGLVDEADVAAVSAGRGDRLGDPAFETRLDLDASGRIDAGDEALAQAAIGERPSVP